MALKDTALDSKILTYGLVAAGLYVVYQIIQGVKAAAQGVADVGKAAVTAAGDGVAAVNTAANNAISAVVSGPVAAAYLAATLPPNMPATGKAALQPGNQLIALSSLTTPVTMDQLSNSAVFDYAGSQYLMSGQLDAQGNYVAQLVGPSAVGTPLTADALTNWS